jgi:ATP-binding cassette subfamily B protein
VIDGGRIVAEGTNAELWHTIGAVLRELLRGPELPPVHAGALVDVVRSRRLGRPSAPATATTHRVELTSIVAGMVAAAATGSGGAPAAGLVAATARAAGARRGVAAARGDPGRRPRRGHHRGRQLERAPPGPASAGRCLASPGSSSSTPARTLVGPLIIRHGLDAGVSVGRRRVLLAMCLVYLASSCSAGATRSSSCSTRRNVGADAVPLRARTFAHLQRLSLDYYDKEMGGGS